MNYDLVLLHPPSVYDFRDKIQFMGPVSDVVPSTSVFEMYPVGFTSIGGYLERLGYKVKIINIANRMLLNPNFNVEKKIKATKSRVYGIGLHWLPHAQGSLELAKIVRKYHPEAKIIFGGLSSTYFHMDLIKRDYIDCVFRGDSTEKPIALFMRLMELGKDDFSPVPNLTWKDRNGKIVVNPVTFIPDNLDYVNVPDYRYAIRSVFKYWNFADPLPYRDWLNYPNTALLTVRGCTQGCIICGGSRTGYAMNCERNHVSPRSPEKLIEDIKFIQRFSRAPIFVIGDIRQTGKKYSDRFLELLSSVQVKNEFVFELFQYADEEFFEKIERSVPRYSIEITLETYDEELRKKNGKFVSSNDKLIDTLNFALKHGCMKIDLFFMVGLPHQSFESAMKNVDFCKEIFNRCGKSKKVSFFIAPLAPFLDPASKGYENPEFFGYKKFAKTIDDHVNLLLEPSWEYTLSYETDLMTRADIVRATYLSSKELNEFKFQNGLIDKSTYLDIKNKIDRSMEFIEKIENIKSKPDGEQQILLRAVKDELKSIKSHEICGDHELKWEVKKNYANLLSLLIVGIGLLFDEWKTELRTHWGHDKADYPEIRELLAETLLNEHPSGPQTALLR